MIDVFRATFGFVFGIAAALAAVCAVIGVILIAIAMMIDAAQAQPTGFGVTAEMVEGAVPIARLERLCDDRPATGLSFTR